MKDLHYFRMIVIMVAVTASLRFLPFAVFRGNVKPPAYVSYLGRVLPYAIMGMLIVYCLRNTSISAAPHGIPELISIAIVTGMQIWRRNTILSILCGTVCYMVMIQLIF